MFGRTVIVKGVAGLGNRLFTLAWAARVGRSLNRTIIADWSDGQIGPKGVDLFSEYFSSELIDSGLVSDWRIHSTSEDAAYKLLPPIYLFHFMSKIGLLHSEELWRRRSGNGPKYILPFEIDVRIRRNSVCAAHLPATECESEIRQIFFNDTTCNRFDKMAPSDIEQRVGLHIRHSDKKADVSFMSVLSDLQGEKLFLATDSSLVREKVISMGLDFVSLTTILHDGKSSGGVHHQPLEAEKKRRAFDEAALDMYCLTKTKKFLGQSNSSFSRIVNIWRGTKRKSQYWDLT